MRIGQKKIICGKKLFIIFFVVLFFIGLSKAESSSQTRLYVSPQYQSVTEGERFDIDIKIDSTDENINAVSGMIDIPTEMLRVISFEKDDGLIDVWTIKPKLLGDKVTFEGVVLNPGFQGAGGKILSIRVEAKKAGKARINFLEGYMLLNDGKGTNILSSLESGDINISRAKKTEFGEPEEPKDTSSISLAPPEITRYFSVTNQGEKFYIKGQAWPGSATAILWRKISKRSYTERIVSLLDGNRRSEAEILIKTGANGNFYFIGNLHLENGLYSVIPYTIGNNLLAGKEVQMEIFGEENWLKFIATALLLMSFVLLSVTAFFYTIGKKKEKTNDKPLA